MNPYIGDRPIDPPYEPDECETCGGSGTVFNLYANCLDDGEEGPCPDCHPDSDPGEPNDYPED